MLYLILYNKIALSLSLGVHISTEGMANHDTSALNPPLSRFVKKITLRWVFLFDGKVQ